MDEQQEILTVLHQVLGEDGCGLDCCEPEVFKNQDGWQLKMEGFLEPWPLGPTVETAKAAIREYADMGFGMR